MTYPYQQEEYYLEGSPDSGEDEGSEGVQMWGADQDASTHYDYDVDQYPTLCQPQHPHQYASQDAAQRAVQHTTQGQSQQVNPWQFEGQYPTHYTSQQPTESTYQYPNEYPDQNMGMNTDEDPYEYSDQNMGKYIDEDSYEYSDQDVEVYTDENPYDYSDQDMQDDTDEDIEDCPDDHPLDDRINYTMEKPTEESNQYLYQFCNAQEGAGSHQTVGTAPVTDAFQGSGLTSLDAQPGPSQPDATLQAAGTWARNHGLAALPDHMSHAYGPGEKIMTGLEPSSQGTDSASGPPWEQEVRWTLASGGHTEEIAENAKVPVALVAHFIASNNLAWTPEQDDLLEALRHQQSTNSVILKHFNSLSGGPKRFDYEVEARIQHLARFSQRVELATSTQSDPQHSVAGHSPASVPPQVSQEDSADTSRPGRHMKHWTEVEVEKIKEWVAEHGRHWTGVENKIPDRTVKAIRLKWRDYLSKNPSLSLSYSRRSDLSEDDISFMKCELARGLSISTVLAGDRFSGFSGAESRVLRQLQENGWSAWRPEENQQVLELQEREGNDWAQITSKADGNWRDIDEVKARYQFLRNLSNAQQLRECAVPHQWSAVANKKLRRALARGMTYTDVAREGFYGLNADIIRRHAKSIHANWTREEDDELLDMNLEPNDTFDWTYVGRQLNPERGGKSVEKRWNFLQRRSRGQGIEDDDEDEDVDVESQSSEDLGAKVEQDSQERGPWEKHEVTILKAWKARNPNTWEGLGNFLPGRSFHACRRKWRDLGGVEGPRNKEWGAEEFTALKEWVAGHDHWPNEGQMIDHLPLRDKHGWIDKWRRHGKPWTDEENNYLNSLQVREDMDWNEVAANLNASMQRGRSAREAEIRYGYLDDCRARGKKIKSLGGGLRRE